jgi:hypothetical protein
VQEVLEKCLMDLEGRLSPDEERANLAAWTAFLGGNGDGEGIFAPPQRTPAPPKIDWPDVHINEAQADYDRMMLSQFGVISDLLAEGSSVRFNVRCNYSTGILPSLFGCEMFEMPPETHTLPTARPLGSAEAVQAVVDRGMPDIRAGLGEKVFTCAERFLAVFDRHPKLAEFVELYHPDLQGPMDVAEVVWGSGIFLAFYDSPDLLRDLLTLITETYIAFMREWYVLTGTPPHEPYTGHWGILQKGRLMIRNDSLMNLSPQVYVDFVRGLDQRLFDEFGGEGAVHFCGRGDHYIEPMSEMRGLTGIQMSQPELNDMETIYRNTVDKGIRLLGFSREAAEASVQAGRALHGRVHCV